ncbi:MAG: PAS domain S-box protein, partial [Chloroflexi bacterium]|nr:PAS domain S-box protein [Chloroflexota bacterium]
MIKTIRAILIGKSYRLIRLGIGLSICFLIFDLLFDVFYFREADILESIFTPSPYEIYMRFSVIVLVLIFSAYVQVITGHLETNQSKLEQELIERKRAEEALRAAKNLLDKTFASLADAVLVVEPKTRTIIACNAAVEHIFGYAEKDVIGRTTEFMHVDRSWFDRFGRELFSALDGAGVFHAEFQMRRKDGSVFPTENTITEIKDELEQRACVVSVVRDITERKRAEEEIKRYLARFQALHQIDNAISGSVGLRITLNVFLEHATTQLGVDAADVLVLNPHTQLLDYAAARGFSTPALQHTHLRVGDGLAGRAALERKTIAISDLNRDINGLARSPSIQSEGFVSYYGVPLIAKGSVNGVLEVFRRTPIPVDQEWKDFLEMMAGQAAIAIESEQLFENLQRSNVDLALAYDATIEGWSRALDLRDKETEGHTQRVTEITMRLAKAMGIGDAELVHIRRGGLLHDIGKMGVPDSI